MKKKKWEQAAAASKDFCTKIDRAYGTIVPGLNAQHEKFIEDMCSAVKWAPDGEPSIETLTYEMGTYLLQEGGRYIASAISKGDFGELFRLAESVKTWAIHTKTDLSTDNDRRMFARVLEFCAGNAMMRWPVQMRLLIKHLQSYGFKVKSGDTNLERKLRRFCISQGYAVKGKPGAPKKNKDKTK